LNPTPSPRPILKSENGSNLEHQARGARRQCSSLGISLGRRHRSGGSAGGGWSAHIAAYRLQYQ